MSINPLDFIGPGTIKTVLKGFEKLGAGDFGHAVSELEHFSNSPLWNKHRVENAQDKINEFWDEYQEDAEDFLIDVKENISEGCDSIMDFVGGLIESLF